MITVDEALSIIRDHRPSFPTERMELRNALGHVRAAQGRCVEACQDFKAALALDPAYTEAAGNCARARLTALRTSLVASSRSRSSENSILIEERPSRLAERHPHRAGRPGPCGLPATGR